jgi:hypothetical protein
MEAILERGSHRTAYKIDRYASEIDKEKGARYRALEARRLFGTKQVTTFNGNPFKTARDGLSDAFFLGLLGRFSRAGQTIVTAARATWYDIRHYKQCNCLLNAGITAMWNLVIGAGGTAFDGAHAYIGVGDSSTAATAAQTGLQAGSNKLYAGMFATYPQVSAQTVTFQASFTGALANFAWNEFSVANGSGGTTAINRVVSSQGTKINGQIWTVNVAILLS